MSRENVIGVGRGGMGHMGPIRPIVLGDIEQCVTSAAETADPTRVLDITSQGDRENTLIS